MEISSSSAPALHQRRRPSKLTEHLVQDDVPERIIEGVYIGSIHAAFNKEALRAERITHILSLVGYPPTFPDEFTYLTVSIRDREAANLLESIPLGNAFIDTVLGRNSHENGDKLNQKGKIQNRVLVHCSFGRSRSVAFIIAYLVYSRGMNPDDALELIQSIRPVACPNESFMLQLQEYYNCNGQADVAQQRLLRKRLKKSLTDSELINTDKSPSKFRKCKKTFQYARVQRSVKLKYYYPKVSCVPVPTRVKNIEYICYFCKTGLFNSSNIIYPLSAKDSSDFQKDFEAISKQKLLSTEAAQIPIYPEIREEFYKIGKKCNVFEEEAKETDSKTFTSLSHAKNEQSIHSGKKRLSHLFIEPMDWMFQNENSIFRKSGGLIRCPGCQASFGTYKAEGSETSWGEMITPSFEVTYSDHL